MNASSDGRKFLHLTSRAEFGRVFPIGRLEEGHPTREVLSGVRVFVAFNVFAVASWIYRPSSSL